MEKEINIDVSSLEEINLLDEIKIKEDKEKETNWVHISKKIDEILLEDFFNHRIYEIINYMVPFNLSENNTEEENEKRIEELREVINDSDFLGELYQKFIEKFLIRNYLKIAKEYEEFKVYQGKDEIISVLIYGIWEVDPINGLTKNQKRNLKKISKEMMKFFSKKIQQKIVQNKRPKEKN